MAYNDDSRLIIMTEIANKLQSLKKQITGDNKLLANSAKINLLEYGYLVGHIEDVHKLLNEKMQDLKTKGQSSKSQIQRNTDRLSRKEGDFWDADRP